MTNDKRNLITKLARFVNEHDALNGDWFETADRDAAFDGGEFSGPACMRALDRALDRAARRFGFRDAVLALHLAATFDVLRGVIR